MTPTSSLLIALVLLLAGIGAAVQSVRTGRWERRGWRIFVIAWVMLGGAAVLYSSYLVSNVTPGG